MLVQPLALPHPSEEPIQVTMIIPLKFLHLFLSLQKLFDVLVVEVSIKQPCLTPLSGVGYMDALLSQIAAEVSIAVFNFCCITILRYFFEVMEDSFSRVTYVHFTFMCY